MNIVLASAEVFPFAKAGGLADVSGYLPKEWAKAGHSAIVIMPKYGHIDSQKYKLEPLNITISVPIGSWVEYAQLWRAVLPGSSVPVYFLESADYFDRHGIYGDPDGFHDNDRRFIFFSRAIFETLRALDFRPDVVLSNDYHTAFAMAFLKIHYRRDEYFAHTAGVQAIHNMAFQGIYGAEHLLYLAQIGLDQFYPLSWFEFRGAVNMLKVGILFADKVTTVSPRYAMEIRYTDQGHGLQDVLNEKSADLVGILNGVDYQVWNPETDPLIYANYTAESLENKQTNKLEFLRRSKVPESELYSDMPLIGMISRLTDQKGIDLVQEIIEHLLNSYPLRFALLGSGAANYEDFFRHLSQKYYPRSLIKIGYDEEISHKIEAAADIFLMPSRFEPCGLNQMYSLKYGTVPLVRATGGLADTVQEFDPTTLQGNGFVFDNPNPHELEAALRRAIAAYYDKALWKRIIQNGMQADNSSTRSAENYIKVFEWALAKIR